MDNIIFTLTQADINAINLKDAEYINNRGAKLYRNGDYSSAVEYYRLAAAMGNMDAVSNLGYCYLYGREIEQNTSLAIAYFKIAAERGIVDAIYKLGDIYSSDKWNLKDIDLSLYYYNAAAKLVINDDWDTESIAYCTDLQRYPSLSFALGREMAEGGRMLTDLRVAYQFLKHAEIGYRTEIDNGAQMYENAYEGVQVFLADPQFDKIREESEAYFESVKRSGKGVDFDEE